MLTNDLVLDRPCPRLLHRQKPEQLQIAVDEWFPVLKALSEVDPDLGTVSGPDGVPILELASPPQTWVEWFRRDSLVVGFDKTIDRNFNAFYVGFAYGQPERKPSRLRIGGLPDLMENPPRLMHLFESAIPIWNASEGRIMVAKSNVDHPWLYWLKGEQEPEGYIRNPMPEGWSKRRPLHDGMLYEWPENRPAAAASNGD